MNLKTQINMEKKFKSFAALLLAASLTFTSCEKNDDPVPDSSEVEAKDIDYNSENAASWGNYMQNVSSLLKKDASNLYSYWSTSYKGGEAYATTFKNHSGGDFSSALNCVEEIFDKCAEIANEVGAAKIGDPMSKYESGDKEGALYAVESWYSWHSRDDYTNNIWSIRNSYYGKISENDNDDSKDIQENSLYNLLESLNPEQNKKLDEAIHQTAAAIQAIPQPFRNNINSSEAKAAQAACLELETVLIETKAIVRSAYEGKADDPKLDAIVAQYTDYVVLPTYKWLMEENSKLHDAVETFRTSPSDANFEAAASAWISAREPWEKSEGFLFGPVDAEGLDPNMDSWPLDQEGIVNILKSGNFDDMNWSEGESDEAIEAAQALRGFHTLEFLLFKDGQPRKVNN